MASLPNLSGIVTRIEALLKKRLDAKLDAPERKAIEREIRRSLGKFGHDSAPAPLSAPTRERQRHGGEMTIAEREVDGTALQAPRYKFEWAVDRMCVAMTAEEYAAAVRFREAFLRRQNTPGAVDWNRSGGSVPGSRLPIRDEQLRASHDFNAVWTRLDPTLRLIVGNFILEEPSRGRSEPFNAVDFGKEFGATKDPNRARGVTVGAVRTAAAVIARLFREYDQWRAEKAREQRQ